MQDKQDNQEIQWHKTVAAECNNKAWLLVEQKDLTPSEVAELVTLASSSRFHWRKIGTSANAAHSDVLFSFAMSIAGSADAALETAEWAIKYFTDHKSKVWEKAFAQAALALAYHCKGNMDKYRSHYEKAEKIGKRLNAQDAEIFHTTFRNLPTPH